MVGLDGTGSESTFTQQLVADLTSRTLGTAPDRIRKIADRQLKDRLGPRLRTRYETADSVLGSGSCSAVMVTANMGSGNRLGSTIDVTVSSMDDARSLKGGVLLLTTLKGVDGEVYAVAQGPLSDAGGEASGVQKDQRNAARVPNGAIVERPIR